MNIKIIALGAVALLAAGAAGYYGYKDGGQAPITSFEECAAAGYPIMESYPERCRTPEGVTFTRVITENAACDADAKICPNGTLVGRIPPSCDFAACPVTIPATSGIRGTVLLGPTCPVMKDPPDPQCADRPFATDLVIATPDGSRTITTFRSDAAGSFKVALQPGSYIIRGNISHTMPTCDTDTFVVKAGTYTEVAVSCDSGIR